MHTSSSFVPFEARRRQPSECEHVSQSRFTSKELSFYIPEGSRVGCQLARGTTGKW